METQDPAPPPNPELLNRQPKWFKPVFYGCIVASVLFAVAAFAFPYVISSKKDPDLVEATSNARQIGIALYEFENKYGSLPSEATAASVTTSNPTHTFNLSGTSSNALFRQLFAAQLTQSEAMFYAKTKDSKKPDGITSRGQALRKGEVGFAYVSGLSPNGNPFGIIALAPIIPGTTKFDRKRFDCNAVVLRVDGSVSSFPIQKDGHIYNIVGPTGIDLLSPTNPIWDGKPFKIHYPE